MTDDTEMRKTAGADGPTDVCGILWRAMWDAAQSQQGKAPTYNRGSYEQYIDGN